MALYTGQQLRVGQLSHEHAISRYSIHQYIIWELLHNYFKTLYNRHYNIKSVIFSTFNDVLTTHHAHNFTSATTHSLKWRQFLVMRKNGPAPFIQNGPRWLRQSAKIFFAPKVFGRPFVKRSLYAIGPLSDCPVCLSVCDVSALWPNGWMDQDETWHGVIGLGLGHMVLDGDPAPPKGHSPQFSAHVCCGQTAV